MEMLFIDWLFLLILIFVFGMKYGFDVDYLVIIDGLICYNVCVWLGLVCYCGILFLLGYGVVVMVIVLGVLVIVGYWEVLEWFGLFGVVIFIIFLVVFGSFNLVVVLCIGFDEVVQLVGIKGCLFGGFGYVLYFVFVVLVGVLFVFFFDIFL